MEEKVHPVTKLASSEGRRAEKQWVLRVQSAHPPATQGFAGLFHDILQCGGFPPFACIFNIAFYIFSC